MCEELELLMRFETDAVERHARILKLMEVAAIRNPIGPEEAARWRILKEVANEALRDQVVAHDRVRQHKSAHRCAQE